MSIVHIVCVFIASLLLLFTCESNLRAGTITFGIGANAFDIDFETIGNPGNAADTTGTPSPAGSVGYEYGMSKFEISREMITRANAEAGLGITLHSMIGITGGARGLMPATGITWFEAAKFTNYLNTNQGFQAAYKFDSDGNFQLWESGDNGFNASNSYRNSLANYVLPSVDEWYKAAYYDPGSESYFNFATGSDVAPIAVASGTSAGTAVYNQLAESGPADVHLAGGLSPYGLMGLSGNVWEWVETSSDLSNSTSSSSRGVRGGSWIGFPWDTNAFSLSSLCCAGGSSPSEESLNIGFRVASLSTSDAHVVPEPGAMLVWGLASLSGLLCRRRLQTR